MLLIFDLLDDDVDDSIFDGISRLEEDRLLWFFYKGIALLMQELYFGLFLSKIQQLSNSLEIDIL